MMLLSQLLINLGFARLAWGYNPDSRLAKNVLEEYRDGYCSPSGPIESTSCLYESVESLNADLFPELHKLVNYPFFRHYKVDLFRECPFWQENGFCMNRACGVEAADESEIPEKWRAKSLSAVSVAGTDGVTGCYFREQDFCYIEDDATPDGEYIDLGLNPERFTGYAGDSAHQVWRAIYEENCFGLSEAALSQAKAQSSGVEHIASAVAGAKMGSSPAMSQSGLGFSKLSEGWGTEMVKSKELDMCEEKKVYYRIISGLHASISIHICQEYLDQQTGEWAPNLDCFVSRLGAHPERLSNVYFNAVLILRAIARAAPYLERYDIATASRSLDPANTRKRQIDVEARETLGRVLNLAKSDGVARGFDEEAFFTGPDALLLKEQFKTHFRNVSRIMDCVGCDKCRLWGKLQVSGIGTALKILFELDDKALNPRINPDLLQRSEVVALFNTMHRISESLAAVESFRHMYRDTQHAAEVEASQRLSGHKPTSAAILYALFEAVRRYCRACLVVPLRAALDRISAKGEL